MTISASLVKELREKTGAGMMDCKKALAEVNGDLEAAVDWLRKKGLAAAAKKAGRVAAEGLVALATQDNIAAAVEVNAETDFVARNQQFQEYVSQVANLALSEGNSIEALKQAKLPSGKTTEEELTNLIAVIGENMNLRRCVQIKVGSGVVASYIHTQVAPNMGRIGVLVALESTGDKAKLNDLGKKIAMHIAAAQPQSLRIEDLDQALVEREKQVLIDQAKSSGRPAEIIEKMVEGRLRKFYQEVVLLEQTFVIDGQTRVADVIAQTEKELGTPVKLTQFVRFVLGDGIEKSQSDFAAEVQQMAG